MRVEIKIGTRFKANGAVYRVRSIQNNMATCVSDGQAVTFNATGIAGCIEYGPKSGYDWVLLSNFKDYHSAIRNENEKG